MNSHPAILHQLFLLFIWIVFLTVDARSQEKSEYGIKAGANFGSVVGPIEKNSKAKLIVGPHVGVYLYVLLHKRFAFQTEFNYSYKGANFSQTSKTGTSFFDIPEMGWENFPAPYTAFNLKGIMKLHYLELPLLLHFRAGQKVSFYFGPQMSYLFAGKSEVTQDIYVGVNVDYPLTVFEDTTVFLYDHINPWDLGVVGGIRFQNNRRLNGTLRLSSSLKSIYRKDLEELKPDFLNVFLNVGIGWRIGKL
jgi:hypothetical protein